MGCHHFRCNGYAHFAAYAFFLHVFGVPESLRPKASLFLHAIGLGMPAVTMYAALRGYSEALGHPRPVTAISLLALVVLIPLNMIFMHGLGPIPALGSAGCGFATSILQWLMLITLAGYIYKASAYRNTSIFSRFDKINLTWVKKNFKAWLANWFSSVL